MGKNHFSFLLVLFGLIFFVNQKASACNKTIDQLIYAGTWFPTKYTAGSKACVEVVAAGFLGSQVSADKELKALAAQAYVECKGWSTKVISFGNSEFGGGGAYNHQWACVNASAETIKIDICENYAANNSRFKDMTGGAKISFAFKNNKCMCSVAGIEGEKDCSKFFPFAQEVAQLKEKNAEEARKRDRAALDQKGKEICEEIKANFLSYNDAGDARCFCRESEKTVLYTQERRKGITKACKKQEVAPATAAVTPPAAADDAPKSCESFSPLITPGPEVENAGTMCECGGSTSGRLFDKSAAGATNCRSLIDDERQRAAAAAAAPTTPTEDLKTCVDEGVKEAQSCKETQELASKTCDENNLDKDAEKIKNAATGAYISSKSGSGAQQECFTASLASNVGLKAIKLVKDDCEVLVTSCKTKCSNEVFEKFEKECKPKVAGIAVNEQYYNSKVNTIKTGLNESLATCDGKVEKDKSVISDLFNQVGDALGKSLQCMCKLSSGATQASSEGCNIPSVQTCDTNPNLPGCKVYSGLGPCTPGSGYDAKLCACQMDAKGAGCPGGSTSGNLVGFASGANINSGGGSEAGFGSPVSDLKAGTANLSGFNGDQPTAAGNLKLDPTKVNAANGGAPGGVGGGGPSGGPGGDPAGGGEGEEEKSGLGGLFNQAKTFMSNLAGGSKSGKGNGDHGSASKNKKPNLDKFRPRGMASSDAVVGTKNMDIWKMMNLCTNGENCKSNVNNYILGP